MPEHCLYDRITRQSLRDRLLASLGVRRCYVEPLRPDTKTSILQNRPQVGPADIEEYECLLAERFTLYPTCLRHPQSRARPRNGRPPCSMHKKLFGS